MTFGRRPLPPRHARLLENRKALPGVLPVVLLLPS